MSRVAIGAVVAAALLAAPAALATRPPTAAQARAIKHAIASYIAAPKSPAAKDNHVLSIAVSTVSPVFARARLDSMSAGPSNALLHERMGVWKVIDFGSGAFPCSDASAKVFKDLFGGCARSMSAVAVPASAPPVGVIPKGPVTSIATHTGELVSVALPGGGSSKGLVWRLARPLNARIVVEVGEANVGPNVVIVFKARTVGKATIVYALTRGESSKALRSATYVVRVLQPA